MRRLVFFIKACCEIVPVFWQFLYGIWRVSKLSAPRVSIFGGARFKENDLYFSKAQELGKRLIELDISILTGGGPGIMEATSCGALISKSTKTHVMGIGVTDLNEKPSSCVQEYFSLDYFFARKWLLTHYSVAFVVFPGGFGTLDELGELLTLIQTKNLKSVPIILFGVEFWKAFMKWVTHEAFKHGTINAEDIKLFTITDDIDHVFQLIQDECKKGVS